MRLAQLYSLMPDRPSECELSAYMDNKKNRQPLRLVPVQSTACTLSSLQQFFFRLLLSDRQNNITSCVVQSS